MVFFNKYKNQILIGLIIVTVYLLIYFLGIRYFSHIYTYSWTARRIYIFAIIPLCLVAFNKLKAAIISAVGYPLGVLFGEIIGGLLYEASVIQHELWAIESDYVQQSMPYHYGWLICITTFVLITIMGLIIERRLNNRIQTQ